MTRFALVALALAIAGCQSAHRAETPLATDYALEVAGGTLSSLQARLDIAAANVANAHTPAFKATRAVIEELPPTTRSVDSGLGSAATITVGGGVRVAGTRIDMSQGPAHHTARELDVMIDGPGFLIVRSQATQTIAYTRAGWLTLNADGELVTPAGERLEPSLVIPSEATHIVVAANGEVSAAIPGNVELSQYGQIQVARFMCPESLKPIGACLFSETRDSGPPQTGTPGEDGRGFIRQGFLEGSNVDVVREQIEIARVQSLHRVFAPHGQTLPTLTAAR